jgi:hypothetical protein
MDTAVDLSIELTSPEKKKRGFAAMTELQQREIASLGGRTSHARGKAHEFTPEKAREAGRLGGNVVARDREHMAAIGRRGGKARAETLRSGASRQDQP